MKLFISWSGKRSKVLAECLRNWIPDVLNATKPWLSAHDIDAGQRWSLEIGEALKGAKLGVLCVTPENQSAPWLLFEAGALSNSVGGGYVIPVLLAMEASELKSPLTQFQYVDDDKEGIYKLLCTINSMLKEPLDGDRLKRGFERCWSDLEGVIVAQQTATPDSPSPPSRNDRQILEEILEISRGLASANTSSFGIEDKNFDLVRTFESALGTEPVNPDMPSSPLTS
jgi:hypothetical protein